MILNEQIMSHYFKFAVFFFLVFSILSCSRKQTEKQSNSAAQTEEMEDSMGELFGKLSESVFTIQTFDGSRILETGRCFAVAPQVLVAPFSFFNEATRAEITPFQGGKKLQVHSFYTFDRIENLILIHCDSLNVNTLNLYSGEIKPLLQTLLIGKRAGKTIPLHAGKFLEDAVIQGQQLYRISNKVESSNTGMPVFLSNGSVLGLATMQYVSSQPTSFAIPAKRISSLLAQLKQPQSFTKMSEERSNYYKRVRSIQLQTDKGTISIRLYNETPSYRDNFLALAREGFYDSLLFHRIIRDFGIQTGAADSRNAQPDDVVGWKGPGYTLPAHIVDGLFHKRGAIGSPRKPDTQNSKRRSDGSQFYIVTGRKYTDEELDELEQENSIKFTQNQRETYKSIGGSPHLDGQYTVFGEVVSGLEVADKMVNVATRNDYRPINDIRLKRVVLVE